MKLLYNARIHTLNPAQETASALLIERGEIIAAGGDELLDARAEKFDLGGRVVLPGLTDAHIHLHHYALGLQKVDCETSTLEECLRRVAERAKTVKKGEWILGHGWNQNEWGELTAKSAKEEINFGGEIPWPSARDLDFAAPDHPVYLTANPSTPRGRTAPR